MLGANGNQKLTNHFQRLEVRRWHYQCHCNNGGFWNGYSVMSSLLK